MISVRVGQVFMLGLMALLAGCASGKFHVKSYNPDTKATGIVYALPRTVVTVAIPYKVTASRRLIVGPASKYEPRAKAELGQVVVTTSTEPDPEQYFEIQTNLTDSVTWKNTFSVSLNENLTLAKSSVTTEDLTLAAFKDVLSSLVGLDELLERSDPNEDAGAAAEEYKRLEAIQQAARNAMNTLLESEFARTPDKDQQALAEARRAFYTEAITYTKQRMAELKIRKPRELTVTILCTVDLSDPSAVVTISESSCDRMRDAYGRIRALASVVPGLVNQFTFELDGSPQKPADTKFSGDPGSAYVYRVPYIGNFTVKSGATGTPIVASGLITIAQLGFTGRIHVKPTRFVKHTSELEMHAATGGIKAYTSKRETSAVSSAASGFSGIIDALPDEEKKPTALEVLQSENTALEAQINNIEFQRKLAELLAAEGAD